MSLYQRFFQKKPIEVIRAEERNEELPRELGLFDLLCIGIGGTVGSGIFATVGDIISKTAGPSAMLGWLLGGFTCILSGFAYMELTSIIPSSGSTYAYSYHVLGELPAVIAGWLLTLEYAVSGAGVARSWAAKVQQWAVAVDPNHSYSWMNEEYYNVMALFVEAFAVCILLCGLRFGKAFINVVTVSKVLVVLFMIIGGLSAFNGENLKPFIPDRNESANDGAGAYGSQGVFLGATQAFFGYVGFDEVCCLAAQAKNPRVVMPRAVVGVIFGTAVLSVLASLALSGMVPYDQAKDFFSAFTTVGYSACAQVVRVGEVVTMPVVVLIAFLAQPQLQYAMACDGLMPQIFAKVNSSGNIFWNTLITGIFFSLVAFCVPFNALWDLVNFGVLLSFNFTNSALILSRVEDTSITLARRLMLVIFISASVACFLYQKGFIDNDSTVSGVFAIVFLVPVVVASITMAVKCQMKSIDTSSFRAPLVPFVPTLAIVLNWFLISQTAVRGLIMGFGWIALAILSYALYGYHHSSARNGWSAILNYERPSTHEVRPSMSSMVKPGKEVSTKASLLDNEISK